MNKMKVAFVFVVVSIFGGCSRQVENSISTNDYSEDFKLAFEVVQPHDARNIRCVSASQGSNWKSTQLIFEADTETFLPIVKKLYPEVSEIEFKEKIVQFPRTVEFENSDFHIGARYFLKFDDPQVQPSRRGFVYVDTKREQVVAGVTLTFKWGPYTGIQEPGVVRTH